MVDGGFTADELVDEARLFEDIPEQAFALLGAGLGNDVKTLAPVHLRGLLNLMIEKYPRGPVPFFGGIMLKESDPQVLDWLLTEFVIPAFGPTKIPAELAHLFTRAMRALLGPVDGGAWMERIGLSLSDRAQIEQETTRSGDCLYEGVNIALGNPIGSHDVLRRLAADFIIEHADLAQFAGLTPDAVVATLVTPRAWAGAAGDLAPIVLASVIRRRIRVVTPPNNTIDVDPIDPSTRIVGDITLYLKNDHYTVNRPADFSDQPMGDGGSTS
jgi:hypothetical protein